MAAETDTTNIRDLSPPGALLAEALEERGMSNADLARRTGLSEKHISQLVNAKATLSMDVAIQLEQALGIPASLWHTMEFNYRHELKRRTNKSRLAKYADWASKFDVRNLVRCGYIDDPGSDSESRVEALLNFFGVSSPSAWDKEWRLATARFRKSPSFEPERFALTSWLRRGEREAAQIRCRKYNQEVFRESLRDIRALTTKAPDVFQPKLSDLGRSAGVAIVLVPALPGLAVSGATRWLTPTKALIQLSLRHKSDDQLWFSFFHEACHVLEHRTSSIFIDSARSTAGDLFEERANNFARDTLIPPKKYEKFVASFNLSLGEIETFAKSVGVSPGIVVGRLQFDQQLPYTHGNGLKRRFQWSFEC